MGMRPAAVLGTDTVTVQGFKLRLDTTSKVWGLLLGHPWELSHGHGHDSA